MGMCVHVCACVGLCAFTNLFNIHTCLCNCLSLYVCICVCTHVFALQIVDFVFRHTYLHTCLCMCVCFYIHKHLAGQWTPGCMPLIVVYCGQSIYFVANYRFGNLYTYYMCACAAMIYLIDIVKLSARLANQSSSTFRMKNLLLVVGDKSEYGLVIHNIHNTVIHNIIIIQLFSLQQIAYFFHLLKKNII